MARKTSIVTIEAEGRDRGKTYKITEFPASKAERWATRAFLALAKSGVEVPSDLANSGFAGFAAVGLKMFGGIAYEDAQPLLDEMLEAVEVTYSEGSVKVFRGVQEDDIEEVATRLQLRMAILELHTAFSLAGAR